jgi:hypothetical protein
MISRNMAQADRRLVFHNHVGWKDAAPVGGRINDGAAADDAARVEHGVAADFCTVAQQRAELPQARVEKFAVHFDGDIARQRFDVGKNHARAEVRLVAENGIADVIKVRGDCVVEQNRVFDFRGVADDAIVADDDVLADVGVVADFAIATDDGRTLDGRAVLDDGAFADKHVFADVHVRAIVRTAARFDVGVDVGLKLLERVPGVFASVKEGGVGGLAQIKQVGRLEHGSQGNRKSFAGNLKGSREAPRRRQESPRTRCPEAGVSRRAQAAARFHPP